MVQAALGMKPMRREMCPIEPFKVGSWIWDVLRTHWPFSQSDCILSSLVLPGSELHEHVFQYDISGYALLIHPWSYTYTYISASGRSTAPLCSVVFILLQAKCFKVVQSTWFKRAICAIVIINIAFLSSYSYGQSHTWTVALNAIDVGFITIYLMEVVLKWQAAGSIWFASPFSPLFSPKYILCSPVTPFNSTLPFFTWKSSLFCDLFDWYWHILINWDFLSLFVSAFY